MREGMCEHSHPQRGTVEAHDLWVSQFVGIKTFRLPATELLSRSSHQATA
jgi:hypothetical protein